MSNYYTQASTDVNQVYGPQYASLDQQVKDAQAQAAQQAATYNAWAQQQAQALQSVAPQIQQTYGAAANSDATFAKGFSDGLTHAQTGNADQINAILARNGAPAGQMQHVTSDAADVLYGLGGYLPATTLNQQGAAFASAAAYLPATALGRGQLAAQGALRDGIEAVRQLELKRYDLNSSKAKDILAQESGYADAATKNAALKWEKQQFAATYGLNVAKYKQGAADKAASRDIQRQSLAERKATAEANLSLRYASVFGVDPNTGQPTLAAKNAAAKDARNKANAKTLSPAALYKLKGDAGQIAKGTYYGAVTTDATPAYKSTAPDPAGWTEQVDVGGGKVAYVNHHPKIGYQQAIVEAQNHGVPLAIILPALNRYYKRGERGRPAKSIYQRQGRKPPKP